MHVLDHLALQHAEHERLVLETHRSRQAGRGGRGQPQNRPRMITLKLWR
ncbi:hypothetical protein [Ornithinimicrobium pekingense]|nr:hypothetical protein [Ornithinimicrobium pekingense]